MARFKIPAEDAGDKPLGALLAERKGRPASFRASDPAIIDSAE